MAWTTLRLDGRDAEIGSPGSGPPAGAPLLCRVVGSIAAHGPWDQIRQLRGSDPDRILVAVSDAGPRLRERALAAGCQGWASPDEAPDLRPGAFEGNPVMWYTLEDGIVTLHFRRALIQDDGSFAWFRDANLAIGAEALQRLGEPFPMLVCMNGLRLDRSVAVRYRKEVLPSMIGAFATQVARYGGEVRTKGIVAMEHIRRSADSGHMFPDRESAIQFVRKRSSVRAHAETNRP